MYSSGSLAFNFAFALCPTKLVKAETVKLFVLVEMFESRSECSCPTFSIDYEKKVVSFPVGCFHIDRLSTEALSYSRLS